MTAYVQEITLEKRAPLSATKKKEVADLLAAKHKEDSKLVKGMFKNLECPGGGLEFAFRMYPQDPHCIYKFEDGKTYEVPLCVARHINVTCNERQHKFVVDKDGNKTTDVVRNRQRYQFLSTEFMGAA
jgi:hypothetical protein